jgi:hypothetical protein
MRKGFTIWLAAVALTLAAGVGVPYGPLAGVQGWALPALWLGFGVAVAALIGWAVAGWRDAP